MVQKRSEVLIEMSALFETVSPVCMPCHDRHVLQMAFTAFIADRAVMGMVEHQPFYNASAKLYRLRVIYRYACAVCSRRHAGHDNATSFVILILELLDSALSAGPDRMHGRMPAEIRHIEAERKAGVKQVLPVFHFIWSVVNIYRCQSLSPRAHLPDDMPVKVRPEMPQCAFQGFHSARGQCAEGHPRTQ